MTYAEWIAAKTASKARWFGAAAAAEAAYIAAKTASRERFYAALATAK